MNANLTRAMAFALSLPAVQSTLATTQSFVYNLPLITTVRQERGNAYYASPAPSGASYVAEKVQRVVAQAEREWTPYTSCFSGTVVNVDARLYDETKQGVTGGLLSYAYTAPSWYIAADWGAGNVRAHYDDGCRTSTVQSDDILFSGGYAFEVGNASCLIFSALAGIPTHADKGLLEAQLGTGHGSIGAQADLFWNFSCNTIQATARLLHFFSRTAQYDIPDRGLSSVTVDRGNLADLLLTYRRMVGSEGNHSIEVGYNPQFLWNSSYQPSLEDLPLARDYTRHTFYTNWTCQFTMGSSRPHAVTLGLSYAFENRQSVLNVARDLIVWAGWGINF